MSLRGLGRSDHATQAQVAAAAFSNFVEVSDRGGSGGGEDNRFWKHSSDRLTRNAFHLMLAAGERPSLPLLLQVVQSLPADASDLKGEAWRSRALNQLLRRAYQGGAGEDYAELSAYFLGEMANLASKTKSIIQATVAGVADGVSRGLAGRLLATDSTFDLGVAIERGAVVVVDLPEELGEVKRLVSVGVKSMTQAAVLRRRVRPDSPLFAVVIDEYQTVVTKSDWSYASRCRSYRGPLIVATQGIESLRSELGGDRAKDEVDTLVSNLGVKCGALPTWVTAQWLCEQLGKTRVELAGGSASSAGYDSPLDFIAPRQQNAGQATGSFSETIDQLLRPDELAGMRTGGPEHGFLVDSIWLQPGRRFDTGHPFCFRVWRQRR